MIRFWDKIKHLFARQKDSELCSFLCSVLGFKPQDISLYRQALTHRSVSAESNERLEFLGDSLIGFVVADELYRMFPQSDEGFLTRVRSKAVCRENLNKIARRIGLDRHLLTATPMKSNSENVFGNAFEALVGAILIDAGVDTATVFIKREIIGKNGENLRKMSATEVDFKSRLLEYAQSEHLPLVFNMLGERYELHDDRHVFVYEVVLGDKVIAQAAGYSKREAQQAVAKKALHFVQNKTV